MVKKSTKPPQPKLKSTLIKTITVERKGKNAVIAASEQEKYEGMGFKLVATPKKSQPQPEEDSAKSGYDFKNCVVAELKDFAEDAGIQDYELMKKPELIEALEEAEYDPKGE